MKTFCQGKAKIVEKAEFIEISEHFETIFNAALSKKMLRIKFSRYVME